MCFLQVFGQELQITLEHLKAGVPHQPCKCHQVYTLAQHRECKRAPEVMGRWWCNPGQVGVARQQNTQTTISKAFALLICHPQGCLMVSSFAQIRTHSLFRLIATWRGSVVWPNARAWRARVPKGTVGSNPTLSAVRAPLLLSRYCQTKSCPTSGHKF
jgi:hypothetical protein